MQTSNRLCYLHRILALLPAATCSYLQPHQPHTPASVPHSRRIRLPLVSTALPNCCRTTQAYMLPVAAIASLVGGTTSFVVRKRRQTRLIAKPQRRFKISLTDNSDTPFQHLQRAEAVRSEQHLPAQGIATSPADSPAVREDERNPAVAEPTSCQTQQQQQHGSGQQNEQQHPYAAEIHDLLLHPTTPVLWPPSSSSSSNHTGSFLNTAAAAAAGIALPTLVPALSDTPLSWIDTPRKLKRMLRELSTVTAFAVDTEHNSQRSYLGITSLLQISTGDTPPLFALRLLI